jgi:PHP family Zn ribbon phosphoesterase
MTPNNILNMSMLKEVDLVSITDHNSTKQLKVFEELQESYNFLLIPGVEVTVKENFDVLCYFRTFNDAIKFDKFLELNLDGEWGIFSEKDQVITDIFDTAYETFPIPLTKTKIPYLSLVKEVRSLNGAIVLAHIDRGSKSVLNVFELNDIDFDAIEIQKYGKEKYLKENPDLKKYKMLFNSDSHTLLSISEKEEYIELEEKTIESFFDFLKGEKL